MYVCRFVFLNTNRELKALLFRSGRQEAVNAKSCASVLVVSGVFGLHGLLWD